MSSLSLRRIEKRTAAGWPYLSSFVAIGFALTFLGPALTYLRERTGSSTGQIAVLFVAQSIGYLLGSLFSGRLYDHGSGNRASATGLVGVAASMLVLPHMATVAEMAIVFALIGTFAGCVDVGGNTLVVWHTRGSGSVRLLNALHMFFGVGALLTPLLINRSIIVTDGLGLAVGVVAIYSLFVAAMLFIHDTPAHTAEGEVRVAVQTPTRILAIVAIFFVLYVGVEVAFSGWIKTYAEGIDLPGKSSPTYVNTLFFVCFTFGRFLAVVLSKRIRSGPMLFGSCMLSCVFLLAMALGNGNPAVVWTTTALIGLSVAPQFATMIAYTEEHITLTGRATSWFIGAAGVGGLTFPFLIGQLLDDSVDLMPIAVFFIAAAATAWLLVVRTALINHRGVPAELVHEPV